MDIYSAQGELMATVEDAFNKYWLQKILEVTYEKKQAYIREGIPFVQGSVRYGYRRVGRKRDARAEVVEELRPIIERIYNWADEGLSIYQARRREALRTDDGELRDLEALIDEQTAELKVAAAEYTRHAARGGILAETFRQQAETLEQTIGTLVQRKAKLEQRMAAKVVSDEEIATIDGLAEWARPRLAVADQDFSLRRQLIEAFNWRFTLVWRGEQRVVVHWRDWDFDVPVDY